GGRPVGPHGAVEGEGEHGGSRRAAHGGDVAEVALEELGSGRGGRDGVVEVFAVDDRIDGDERAVARAGEHGAVVADAGGRGGAGVAEPAGDGGDQAAFAEGGDGVGGVVGEGVHRVHSPPPLRTTRMVF